MSQPRIGLLGLGNLMRTDDAAGMLAVQQLVRDHDLPSHIVVVQGGTLGLDLLYSLEGVTHLLAIDAIEAGAAPGTILRFANDETSHLPVSKSVHLLGFADLVAALRLTGGVPWEVVVLGVQPEATGWGTELTAAVRAAIPKLIHSALAELGAWTTDLAALHWPTVEFPRAQETRTNPIAES